MAMFSFVKDGILTIRKISIKAIMARLKTQLPIISPSAISGAPTMATELMPVISSGRDVTLAIKIRPIHALPSPDFSAITSPYFDNLIPEKTLLLRPQ